MKRKGRGEKGVQVEGKRKCWVILQIAHVVLPYFLTVYCLSTYLDLFLSHQPFRLQCVLDPAPQGQQCVGRVSQAKDKREKKVRMRWRRDRNRGEGVRRRRVMVRGGGMRRRRVRIRGGGMRRRVMIRGEGMRRRRVTVRGGGMRRRRVTVRGGGMRRRRVTVRGGGMRRRRDEKRLKVG